MLLINDYISIRFLSFVCEFADSSIYSIFIAYIVNGLASAHSFSRISMMDSWDLYTVSVKYEIIH